MSSILIGVLAGLYAGNPTFRANVDATIKKAVAYGIDTLNGKPALIEPPQETTEDE